MTINPARLLRIFLRQRPPETDNDFLKLIYSRKSCRNFSARAVPEDIVNKVLDAGALAPSTVNLQTWSFFPFSVADWRDKFGTPIPFGAQSAIIICADLKRLESVDEAVRDYPLFFYTIAVMNASLAAMNMTLAIEAQGLRSIMLSQTGKTGLTDVFFLKEKLSLPDLVFPLMTLAFGYPASELQFSPPKLDTGTVTHHEEYCVRQEQMIEWYKNMETVCRIVEKEKLTEKFDKYKKLLPQAEEDLKSVLSQIKR
jgi:nitroreductase